MQLKGDPDAALTRNGRLVVFARGLDNAIWHRWQLTPNGNWSAWESLGSESASGPGATLNAPGGLVVFIRGTDSAIWHRWQNHDSGPWSNWESLGGNFATDPDAVLTGDGRLVVFARGHDNAILHRWQVSPNGDWSGWESLGGILASGPGTALNAPGGLVVFARGTDGAIWHCWQSQNNGDWSNWESLGGNFATDPDAVLMGDGRLVVFARGHDNAIWHRWQVTRNGDWSGWESLGGSSSGGPGATLNAPGGLVVFIIGTDGSVWHRWQNRNSGDWSAWESLGSPVKPPQISGFTPKIAKAGDEILINGTEFEGEIAIQFGNIHGTFELRSANTIAARVPAGAVSGPLTIRNSAGVATSADILTIELPLPGESGPVCRSNAYEGLLQEQKPWTNRDEHTFRILGSYLEPRTLPELVEKVAQASEQGREIHALGSGWAFEDLAVSPQWVVNLCAMTKRLTDVCDAALTDEWQWRQQDPQSADHLVHFEAGIEIGALNDELHALGLALPTLGGANGQTLAGAFSTSTHGGDIQQPPLPDVVRALHLVAHGGREVWIEPASAPITTDERLRRALKCPAIRIIRDDEVFHAALVSVGRFGVIYSMVFQVTRAFRLIEWTIVEPSSVTLDNLHSGIQGGSPLGDALSALPPPAAFPDAQNPDTPHFFQILFNPQDSKNCFVTRRWKSGDPEIALPNGGARAVFMAPLPDGRLEFWAADDSGRLWSCWKLTPDPDADWSPWTDVFAEAGALPDGVRSLCVGRLPDRRLELFVADGKGGLWSRWKLTTDPNADWSGWHDVVAEAGPLPGGVRGLCIGELPDGRLELFVADGDGGLWSRWKLTTDPNADWSGWHDVVAEAGPLPGGAQALCVGALPDGRLELFVADGNGGLWSRWKLTADPNGDWSGWHDVIAEAGPLPGGARAMCVGALPDGRLELFVADGNGVLWSRWKLTNDPNAEWSGWNDFLAAHPLPHGVGAVCVAPLPDRRLHLWVADRNGSLWASWKLTQDPSAEWATWSDVALADRNVEPPQDPRCRPGGAQQVLDEVAKAISLLAAGLTLIPVVGWALAADLLFTAHWLRSQGADPDLSTGEALALSLNTIWHLGLGFVVPGIASDALEGQFKPSRDGRRGPSHLITSGTRASSADKCYLGASIEVVFPADQPEYVQFVRQLLERAPSYRQVGYVSMRYSRPSRATLSMHNFGNSPTVSIEIASLKGLDGNNDWLTYAEKLAISRGGRPHWGQINKLTEAEVSNLYGANLERWRRALAVVSGASTVFSNNFTRQRGLEPLV